MNSTLLFRLVSAACCKVQVVGQGQGLQGWPVWEEVWGALCWGQLVPASSTVEPLWATAEPISKAGDDYVKA